jgi:hypothetical protein
MSEHKPHPANVPGDYYVEDGCCTMCEFPFGEAAELFGVSQDGHGQQHCFVKQQPRTDAERERMIRALSGADLDCIRYRGTDYSLQLRLVELGMGRLCDRLPPKPPAAVRWDRGRQATTGT